MTLQYFEFYRGNIATGFDYVYAKMTDDHSFILGVPKTNGTLPEEITEADFDFGPGVTPPFKYQKYEGMWREGKFQWPGIEAKLNEFLLDWKPSYRAPQDVEPYEWGLRVKMVDEATERRYIGVNNEPVNFDKFLDWMNMIGSGVIK